MTQTPQGNAPQLSELLEQERRYHDSALEVRHALATQGRDAAIEELLTEDNTPVDNLLSEKLQRFLVQAFYSAYGLLYPQSRFLAVVDVALYEYLGAVHDIGNGQNWRKWEQPQPP
jgi:hypothetical protein